MFSTRRSALHGILSATALVAVVAGVKLDLLPRRLWSLAAFLGLWLAAASYLVVAAVAVRRRAARLRTGRVPQGVRLTQPFWIPLMRTFDMLMTAAMLPAIAAAIGFPAVAVGITLPIVALGLLAATVSLEPACLIFEPAGLRVHERGSRFMIAWAAIGEVAVTGPSHYPSTTIEVISPEQVLATIEPDTPRTRRRVAFLMAIGGQRTFCSAPGPEDWTA